MTDHRPAGLTNGYLPAAAFRHVDATAVGIVDLDQPMLLQSPDSRSWEESHHDGLLLVRLHREPIAIVHIEGDLSRILLEDLAAKIWQDIADDIHDHIKRFRCAPVPQDFKAFVKGLGSPLDGCPGVKAPDPAASVTVVVPTTGRYEQLSRCLRSLLAMDRQQVDVLVVDNRPATGEALRTINAIVGHDPRVRYVAEPRPGSSIARNRGAAETDAEIVAFTDDDVVVDPHWLNGLLAPFADADVTAVTGMVLPLELQTPAQKRFEQFAGFSKGISRRSYKFPPSEPTHRVLYPFWGGVFGSGNSMAFRRVNFVDSGGFDPALGGGSPAKSGEDIEAMSAAILGGGTLVYEPRSLCWHEHRKEDDALHQQVFDYGVGLGAVLTKALTHDPRFFGAVVRSVPIAFRLRWHRQAATSVLATTWPPGFARLQRKGMLKGPFLYAEGLLRSRRLQLSDVIRGR